MTDVECAHVAEPNEWWNAFLDSIDEVQTADVKPTNEPGWTTARIVRDKFGDLWIRNRYAWLIFAGHANGSVSPLPALASEGPLTVVIDADGNNVEADRLRAEVADAEFELHDEQSVSQSLRLQLLAARQDIARLESENARLQAQLGDGR